MALIAFVIFPWLLGRTVRELTDQALSQPVVFCGLTSNVDTILMLMAFFGGGGPISNPSKRQNIKT